MISGWTGEIREIGRLRGREGDWVKYERSHDDFKTISYEFWTNDGGISAWYGDERRLNALNRLLAYTQRKGIEPPPKPEPKK